MCFSVLYIDARVSEINKAVQWLQGSPSGQSLGSGHFSNTLQCVECQLNASSKRQTLSH